MGISINNLDGNLNPGEAAWVSSNETASNPKGFESRNNLRELVDGELNISGGEMQKNSVYVNNRKGVYAVYGQGIDLFVNDGFDDIAVFGDDVSVYSNDKDINVRQFKRVNRIVEDIEDLISQI